MVKLVSVFIIFLVGINSAFSQNGLRHHYTFNGCNGSDAVGTEDGFLVGISDCPCGVDGDAIDLNGMAQFADFPRSLNEFLVNDFTFSFYMWPMSTVMGNDAIDIWSIGETCGIDSIFYIRYFPVNGELRVRISDQPRNGVDLTGFLSQDNCWSYVAITKEDEEYKLFIDSREVDNDFSPIASTFLVDDVLTLSISPCMDMQGIAEYEGLIDELRIYDRALNSEQLIQEDFFPDQIVEDKIILFKGESVIIESGGTCANDFTWSPELYLDDPSSTSPLATPDETITYTLTVNHDDCQVIDEIDIIVVDVEELDCNQLLLPSAFTPNGDGLNDTYGISNDFILDELISFEVFDKWGGRLFFSTEQSPKWNGQFRNDPVMPGAYVYRVKYVCSGEELILNGVVNVIR